MFNEGLAERQFFKLDHFIGIPRLSRGPTEAVGAGYGRRPALSARPCSGLTSPEIA